MPKVYGANIIQLHVMFTCIVLLFINFLFTFHIIPALLSFCRNTLHTNAFTHKNECGYLQTQSKNVHWSGKYILTLLICNTWLCCFCFQLCHYVKGVCMYAKRCVSRILPKWILVACRRWFYWISKTHCTTTRIFQV